MKKSAMMLGAALLAGIGAAPASAHPPVYTPRVFMGELYYSTDVPSVYGTLQASDPACTLTVSTGSAYTQLVEGSRECAGSYELVFGPGSANSLGNESVSTGTFTIVDATDQKTVEWAGTYTQVTVVTVQEHRNSPDSNVCDAFCANLGAANPIENLGYNGDIAVALELNVFTWFVPSKK